jgi:hypothetical protein
MSFSLTISVCVELAALPTRCADSPNLLVQVSALHVYGQNMLIWAWHHICKLECGSDNIRAAMKSAICNVLNHADVLSVLVRI